jgi:hypothetical protein
MDNFNLKNFINENNLGAYSKLEGKKRDVDGDGDIDSDDYMAAKDAAIKKAMGKTEAIADPDSLTSIIMGGLAAVGAVKALPKLVDILGDETGDITIDSLKKALSKKDVKEASKEEEETFHKKLDTLVHKTFGKRKEEMDENRFLAASMEDLEQVVRNLAHTGEMSEDEAIEMAISKLEAMLDGRDDLDEDLDIGHQDDEPNMLKKTLYRTAKMAAMIYKELDKFDQFPNEVDFPNWWQAKLIKANDYLNSAFDYLDGEQQTAKLDAMAEKKVEVDDETDFKVKLSHLLDKHVDN